MKYREKLGALILAVITFAVGTILGYGIQDHQEEPPPIICIWESEERIGKVGHLSYEFQVAGELDRARMLRAAQTAMGLRIEDEIATLMEDYIQGWVAAQQMGDEWQ